MVDYTPGGRVGKLVVRGRKLRRDIADAVLTGGSVSLTTGEVPQLTITVEDANGALLASRLFDLGGQADYADLKLEVAAVGTLEVDGVPAIEVAARSLGAQRMRRAKGKLVERKLSPTQYMSRRARHAGLTFLGQPSARRNTIRRQTGDSAESDWDTGQRLARELGFMAFVSGGRYYFGQPTWIMNHTTVVKIAPGTPGLLARPQCRRSADNPKAATLDLDVDDVLAAKLRPGTAIDLSGVPTFNGRYLVEDNAIPLEDEEPVSIAAATAINPRPEPPEVAAKAAAGTGASSSGSSGSGTRTGGRTAAAFVQYALAQAGDRYVFGAEVNLNDRDPDVFDCSELVEWAAWRCGVAIPDGSANQYAHIKRNNTRLTVAEAIRTRGALLFGAGPSNRDNLNAISHVAISLGNGRTIEAVNRTYGVRQMSATGRQSIRWVGAGRVPGLAYPRPILEPLGGAKPGHRT